MTKKPTVPQKKTKVEWRYRREIAVPEHADECIKVGVSEQRNLMFSVVAFEPTDSYGSSFEPNEACVVLSKSEAISLMVSIAEAIRAMEH